MAKKIEENCNLMFEKGYELITMSITNTAKAILVFKSIINNDLNIKGEK